MKIVQGFLDGFLVVGVLTPPLALSVVGDFGSAPVSGTSAEVDASGEALPLVTAGISFLSSADAVVPSLAAASRSARSLSLRSFFSFFFAFSLSAFSVDPGAAGAPLGFAVVGFEAEVSFGVSRSEVVA
jgi:hypothetical protein